jgi:hypothetical protein
MMHSTEVAALPLAPTVRQVHAVLSSLLPRAGLSKPTRFLPQHTGWWEPLQCTTSLPIQSQLPMRILQAHHGPSVCLASGRTQTLATTAAQTLATRPQARGGTVVADH